jgi:hypothetical protein
MSAAVTKYCRPIFEMASLSRLCSAHRDAVETVPPRYCSHASFRVMRPAGFSLNGAGGFSTACGADRLRARCRALKKLAAIGDACGIRASLMAFTILSPIRQGGLASALRRSGFSYSWCLHFLSLPAIFDLSTAVFVRYATSFAPDSLGGTSAGRTTLNDGAAGYARAEILLATLTGEIT